MSGTIGTAAPCPLCKQPVEADRVWCYDCARPYHENCFLRSGVCVDVRCQGMRYSRTGKRQRDVTEIEVRTETAPALQAVILDLHTSAESLFPFALWAVPVTTLFIGGFLLHANMLGVLAVCVTLGCTGALIAHAYRRQIVDEYYVLDARRGGLRKHVSYFGRPRVHLIAALEEIEDFGVVAQRGFFSRGNEDPDSGVMFWLAIRPRGRDWLPVSDNVFVPWPPEGPLPAPPTACTHRADQVGRVLGRPLPPVREARRN